ncbi:MAG: CocE/NonD family hydrolase [Gemmatimonadetes bacterium]|nr:CocE/NonD family hydrolase [Gemmatimonadota bacterium]
MQASVPPLISPGGLVRAAASVLTAALAAATPAAAQAPDTAAAIPMRDGVILRATVLKPEGAGPFPVLVYRTPYGQRAAVRSLSTFRAAVRRGYAVVAQDVRGRYLSDGTFDPYRQEGRDGYDTIEWAARQPWSTGAVGTFGLSYPGAVQWLAAVEAPPSLKAMVPAMTFSRPTNFWYAGGVADLSWPAWIWLNIAPDTRVRLGLPGPRTAAAARAEWTTLGAAIAFRLPITDVPELDRIAPWFAEWYRHPPNDPWWDWADLTTKYHRVSAAVLNLSGWHDDNYGPEGAITNHRGLVAARASADDPRTSLVVGPWVHGISGINDSSGQARVGERIVGPAAGIGYDETILQFMDRHLRGLPGSSVPRVRLFVMGENAWRTGETWPLPGTVSTTLYFAPDGRLELAAPPVSISRRITSDPANPIVDPFAARAGAHDYRSLAGRADVLSYETEPLERDLRVAGAIRVTVAIETDAPSIDVWAKVLDVGPDGTAWNVVTPGLDLQRSTGTGPRLVHLDHLVTGNLFKRGHRLRIVVMNSFMPNFSRNPQTGRSETEERETRPAAFALRHGPGLSHLILPVIP